MPGFLKITEYNVHDHMDQGRSLATGRCIGHFFFNFLKVEIFQIPSCHILEKMNENYDKKKIFGYHDALKIYGASKLCTFM